MECTNCGMLPFACVCIPWCNKHDVKRPCDACDKEWLERQAIKDAKAQRRYEMFRAILAWFGGR